MRPVLPSQNGQPSALCRRFLHNQPLATHQVAAERSSQIFCSLGNATILRGTGTYCEWSGLGLHHHVPPPMVIQSGSPRNRKIAGAPLSTGAHRERHFGSTMKCIGGQAFAHEAIGSSEAENLLSHLSPRLDAFAMCAVSQHQALRVGPTDEIIVHYVLSGQGSLEWGGQRRQLLPGMVAIIPKAFPKMIAGPDETRMVTDATATCMLVDGMIKFETPEVDGHALILACAKVFELAGSRLGLFDCLREPLIEPGDPNLTWAFEGILRELSRPVIGCKAIIESFMKQVLLLTLRTAISEIGPRSPLFTIVQDPQLAHAISAINLRPAERHTTENLARISGMTSAALSEKFQRVFGQTPAEYVRRVRLGASIPMLLETNLPVKTIAAAVGFASRSHFSRAFSKVNGRDPSAYRHAENPSGHLPQNV